MYVTLFLKNKTIVLHWYRELQNYKYLTLVILHSFKGSYFLVNVLKFKNILPFSKDICDEGSSYGFAQSICIVK